MIEISSKNGKVAESRYKLNLQLFAGDTPDLEDSPEYAEDMLEFDRKMESYMQDRSPKEEASADEPATETVEDSEPTVTPEVVTPEKPKQDSETNKAFQEMRKAREDAERKLKETEDRAKKADELIAQQYGESHGIYTVEQYENRLNQEREQEQRQRYEDAGLTPEEVQALKEHPALKEQRQAELEQRQKQDFAAGWQKLYASYPEVEEAIKKFNAGEPQNVFNDEMRAEIERGASPIAAYRSAHFDTILQRQTQGMKETAKQEALNSLNSKNHLKPSGDGSADVDSVEIDPEQMAMYRRLTGKTDADIRKWHKKNVKS